MIHAEYRDLEGNLYYARMMPDGTVSYSYTPDGKPFRTLDPVSVLAYAVESDMAWSLCHLASMRLSTRARNEDLATHRAILASIESDNN